jgi:hypothetical protein
MFFFVSIKYNFVSTKSIKILYFGLYSLGFIWVSAFIKVGKKDKIYNEKEKIKVYFKVLILSTPNYYKIQSYYLL